MKIGLIGEAPNDTKSIENLLKKEFPNLEYIELLKNKYTGSQLENQKTKHIIRKECQIHRPNIVIFIRDLDGLLVDAYKEKIKQRTDYYKNFKGSTQTKTIFLLNVWELEALILSDFNAFNTFYDTDFIVDVNPMEIQGPKEYLKNTYRKYSESDNSKILDLSDPKIICANCEYYKKFIEEFDALLKAIK